MVAIFLQDIVQTYKVKCDQLCICICYKFYSVSFCQQLAKLDDF